MTDVSDISHFLAGMAGWESTSAQYSRGKTSGWPFVTISRQVGAGGRTLAEHLLKVMSQEPDQTLFGGWQICDQELCVRLVEDHQLQVSMQELLSEEYRSQIHAFFSNLLNRKSDQELVMLKMFETIRSLATVGKVILVGRASSQVTKKLTTGVHLRLVAPEEVRIKRTMQLFGQPEAETKRLVQKQDQDRERLVKSYFFTDINDPLLYDATWNTAHVPFQAIAESTVILIKKRFYQMASPSESDRLHLG